MAHFALIDDQNIVQAVHVITNCAIGGCVGEDSPIYQQNPEAHIECGTLDYPDTEPFGQSFQESIGLQGKWIQCSYNASFRGAYPGMGWSYDPVNDVFVPPSDPDPAA